MKSMKRDLYFSKPLINSAGSLGFAPDLRVFKELEGLNQLGAFVTNPISLRPRMPTANPSVIEFSGGVLLHTGLPNAGFSNVIKKYSAKWNRSELPIIVNLMADRPEETQQMVRQLENIENVMAVQLGFAPLLSDDIILLNLEMCLGELPLIFALPHEQILSLGAKLIQAGASAISIASPRGTIDLTPNPSPERRGELISGRMYGRSLFPRSLDIVRSAGMIGLPIIGAGGVWSDADVESMLAVGAMAVETDIKLWVR
ncbi:MAG: dihydroorotate dehydrogenase 1B [Chloroflexi bacterium OLB14]|nr:MAG: dihydroorotate dehydrogenase 1B [Chloroflexi bacterium OLB14]